VRRLLLCLALTSGALCLNVGPAVAGCSWVEQTQMLDGAINVTTEWRCDGEPTSGSGTASSSTDGPVPIRDSDLDPVCVRGALAVDQDPFVFCLPEEDMPEQAPQVTPGMVTAAFRRLPLPAARLQVQPPNGRTLVNFATNFYTERGDLTRSVTLLGRRVDLRITASSYTWRFGDGSTATTSEPGAPYPALDVTHDYRKAGRVTPSVDTTYTAEFSVDGGPWRPVTGTVTIPGAPVGLRVLTATPTLVGYR
jgi:hypothetical protein